jgi:hypothetical protein
LQEKKVSRLTSKFLVSSTQSWMHNHLHGKLCTNVYKRRMKTPTSTLLQQLHSLPPSSKNKTLPLPNCDVEWLWTQLVIQIIMKKKKLKLFLKYETKLITMYYISSSLSSYPHDCLIMVMELKCHQHTIGWKFKDPSY